MSDIKLKSFAMTREGKQHLFGIMEQIRITIDNSKYDTNEDKYIIRLFSNFTNNLEDLKTCINDIQIHISNIGEENVEKTEDQNQTE